MMDPKMEACGTMRPERAGTFQGGTFPPPGLAARLQSVVDGCCRPLTEREAVDGLRRAMAQLPPGLHDVARSLNMQLHVEMLEALVARRELGELRASIAAVNAAGSASS